MLSGLVVSPRPTPLASLVVVLLLSSCSPTPAEPRPTGGAASTTSNTVAVPRGTIRIAWGAEPPSLRTKFVHSGATSANNLAYVFNAFLVLPDLSGAPQPMLSRLVPNLENGGVVIAPDGTMITTYGLRPEAKWHDGNPVTAEDFVFAFQVYVDPSIEISNRSPENLMVLVEATDLHTLKITWKQPYYQANVLGHTQLEPLPRHLLAEKYQTNKAQFTEGAEWTATYIGVGPFRVDRWNPGSGVIARANADWFLGAPKIDTLDIRFVTDSNTVIANLLSGEVDVSNSPSINAPLVAALQPRWVGEGMGYVRTFDVNIQLIEFQYRDVPGWQSAVSDVRVRQALTHGLDRDALASVMTDGLGPRVDVHMLRTNPLFHDVELAATKYPYDPNRSASLLAEAGWRRPQPGALAADVAGQTLDVDVWRYTGPDADQEVSIIADNWKSVGINSGVFIMPASRTADTEFRVSFPAVNITNRPVDSPESFWFTSAEAPKPEERWRGRNRGSFVDPEVDRLQATLLRTVDPVERRLATVALNRRMSEAAAFLPLYYRPEVVMISNRVRGPAGLVIPGNLDVAANLRDWELAE